MESASEVPKLNAITKEKHGLDVSKLLNTLDGKDSPQSILRKSPISSQNAQNLLKLLPKPIPLKTLQGPNGNIIVHGPHNKLVSLQLKHSNAANTPTTSTISLLPITIPKDVKSTNKIPALALIGSHVKGSPKNVIITKDMLPNQSSTSSPKLKEKTLPSAITISSLSNKGSLPKGKELKVGNIASVSLNSQTSLLSIKMKNNSSTSINISNFTNSSAVSTKAKDTSTTTTCINSLLSSKSAKDISTNNTKISLSSNNTNSILLPKKKDASSNSTSNNLTSSLNLKTKESSSSTSTNTPATSTNCILPTKTFKEVSISKTVISSTASQSSILGNKLKEACLSKSTKTTSSSNIILPTKNLEIKPITVVNSSKTLTPAQAATVPITSTKISNALSLNKNIIVKTDTSETPPTITIEKKNCKAILPLTFNKDLIQTAANSSLINRPKSVPTSKTPEIPVITRVSVNLEKDKKDVKKPVDKVEESNKINDTIIRCKESLIACFNKNKVKQQSLLKNKAIEKLKRSPRTKVRSKSLTSITAKNGQKVQKIGRRLSTCSESGMKKYPKPTLTECLIKAVRDSTPPKTDKSLLCHEKIEISPTNSILQTSNESLLSSNISLDQPDSTIIKPEIIDLNEPENILPDLLPFEEIKSPKQKSTEIPLLNWKDGVGITTECKLNFQMNEFGLIEIADDVLSKFRVDIGYDKPIYEREYKSQNTSDYSDPLYYCKGCNCRGAAVDFLVPDFCSHECIQRYNYKCLNGLTLKIAGKKYINRRKDMERTSKSVSGNIPKKPFNWSYYLNSRKEEPASIDLFPNPFPCGPNLFKIGMKLEAIDPEHSNLFCVCTVIDKRGYRLKLHFDGYSKKYDFWLNADSMDIFPPGWCSKTNRTLQPPRGMSQITFNWPMYLNKTRSAPAPRNLFTHLNSSSTTNPFVVGMKLEADDLRNTRKVCVASVADVLDNRILIHFDGWDESYDYWIDINSPYIHPVNWHKRNGFSIVPPPEWDDNFDWKTYLSLTSCTAATSELFSTRDPISFHVGMKLEVVDKKNPSLIRPATVIMADEYEIKVLFDGWPEKYAFWVVDDSPDIHPVGWCEATGHELEAPPEFESLRIKMPCPIIGCRGIGNAKRTEIDFHANAESCPYDISNWNVEIDKSQRLEEDQSVPHVDLRASNKRKSDDTLIYAPPKIPKVSPSLENNTETKQIYKPEMKNIFHQLLCDYGPRLQYAHSIWMKNSEYIIKHINEPIVKNPLEWTVSEVSEYINKMPRCHIYSDEFKKREIDGSAFLSMRQTDLTDLMDIKLGAAIKIYNQVIHLRGEVVTNFPSSIIEPPPICLQE